MIASLDYSYEISINENNPIPLEWIIEFSDPIMGHKYNNIDHIRLKFIGRDCGNGMNNFGLVSSQHDRKFIWADSHYNLNADAWGRGACTTYPDENAVDCNGKLIKRVWNTNFDSHI